MDVIRSVEVTAAYLPLYPASIRGLNETALLKRKIFLGCNWGAFAKDIKAANFFSPYFGPGSITNSVGQESQMMHRLLKLGLKPFPVTHCRVKHFAPDGYHEINWLVKRKYREGMQMGLLSHRYFRTIAKKTIRCLAEKDPIKRKATIYFILGMLFSLKYYFKNIDK